MILVRRRGDFMEEMINAKRVVDAHDVDGERTPPKIEDQTSRYSTHVFQDQIEGIDAILDKVISSNITYDLSIPDDILHLTGS